MTTRNPTHTHRGNENNTYYPERKKRVIWRDNPHGYLCQWCGKVIPWLYRGNEPWVAPRFYCQNHICQGVREVRSRMAEAEGVVLNSNVRHIIA